MDDRKLKVITWGDHASATKEHVVEGSVAAWKVIGNLSLWDGYEVRDCLTNEIVDEFIPL